MHRRKGMRKLLKSIKMKSNKQTPYRQICISGFKGSVQLQGCIRLRPAALKLIKIMQQSVGLAKNRIFMAV